MKWILIILLSGRGDWPVSSLAVEFDSKPACTFAMQKVIEAGNYPGTTFASCFPKGDQQ